MIVWDPIPYYSGTGPIARGAVDDYPGVLAPNIVIL